MSVYATSEVRLRKVKIVVAGGFGSGKTTLVGAVSEVRPLVTEAVMTWASEAVDPLVGVESKMTTTVAMDFGKFTLWAPGQEIVLMLFGTPGQDRFHSIWDDLSLGAVGAVVLVDTRRLEDAFAVLAYFEEKRLPFLVAVNQFEGAPRYLLAEVREALRLDPDVPVVPCDARERGSVIDVLIGVVRHALRYAPPYAVAGADL